MRVAGVTSCTPCCRAATQSRHSLSAQPRPRPFQAASGACRGTTRVRAVASPTDTGMQIHDARELDAEALRRVLARPRIDFSSVLSTVRACVWLRSGWMKRWGMSNYGWDMGP